MKQISERDWEVFLEGPCKGVAPERRAWLRSQLSHYLSLLAEANERVNLTAIKGWEDGVWKHLYDSLLVASVVPRGTLLDWGSGGGTPGIPVALWRRAQGIEDSVVLLDSVQKKMLQVEGIVAGLECPNVSAVWGRGEIYLKKAQVDAVVMRAVAPPDRATKWVSKKVSRWIFMVGPTSREEWLRYVASLGKRGFELALDGRWDLPGGLGVRHILEFRQRA